MSDGIQKQAKFGTLYYCPACGNEGEVNTFYETTWGTWHSVYSECPVCEGHGDITRTQWLNYCKNNDVDPEVAELEEIGENNA
jgi:hypothetical protein